MSNETALDIVAGLLNESTLAGVNYFEVSMTRLDSEPIPPGEVFPAGMELEFQVTEHAAIFKLAVEVRRPDLAARVVVGIMYTMPDTKVLAEAEVSRLFGEKVAIPAVYPYARAKLADITADVGVSPVLLGIMDVSRLRIGETHRAEIGPA